jgi:trans-2,3-dihydro-3-hydroxyanthranilate isomerase
MTGQFVLCDVFAEKPFAGNPLAVFLDGEGVADDTMGLLAREFEWSEITFVIPPAGDGPTRVRIWTPDGELPFAGHPTVGTAVVLAAMGRTQPGLALLELGVGPVAVEVSLSNATNGRAVMTQRQPIFGQTVRDRTVVAAALGLTEADLAPDLPVQIVSTGLEHLLVPLRSLEALGRARGTGSGPGSVTYDMADQIYAFSVDTPGSPAAARARLLGPGREDAATGSAAGPLGAYLVRYGLHRAGAMDIEQGIEMGRPSLIQVDVPTDAGEIGPVRVAGDVRIWGTGTLS